MINKRKFLIGFYFVIIIIILGATISAERVPIVGGDNNAWGTILNEYLNVSLNESGHLRPTNLTFAQKVTFAFGETIDNIVNGWIRIVGGLNVTENLNVVGNATIEGNLDVAGNVTASYFVGDGSELTRVGGMYVNKTSATYNGTLPTTGGKIGYEAANAICDAEFPGSRMCSLKELMSTIDSNNISAMPEWSGEGWYNSGGPKYAPAPVPASDCDGWTKDSTLYLGNFWRFNQNGGGVGAAALCNSEVALACCR